MECECVLLLDLIGSEKSAEDEVAFIRSVAL